MTIFMLVLAIYTVLFCGSMQIMALSDTAKSSVVAFYILTPTMTLAIMYIVMFITWQLN